MVVAVSEKDPTEGEVMVTDPAVEARVRSGIRGAAALGHRGAGDARRG